MHTKSNTRRIIISIRLKTNFKSNIYTLWLKNESEKFNKYIDKYKNEMLEAIKEAKIDNDFSDEEERQDYIRSYEEYLEKLITMSNKIQNGNYKPKIELKLYPEYGCFLIDCIRHNF